MGQYSSPCRLQASLTRSAAGMRTYSDVALPSFSSYQITAKPCMESVIDGMESRAKGYEEYSLTADAMRGRAAIPYNSLCELMPYQALRSWINKKRATAKGFPLFVGGASFKKVEPMLFVNLKRFDCMNVFILEKIFAITYVDHSSFCQIL